MSLIEYPQFFNRKKNYCIVRLADLFCERWRVGIIEQVAEHNVEDFSWRLLSNQFLKIFEQPFETLEEDIGMEFENNHGFLELFV